MAKNAKYYEQMCQKLQLLGDFVPQTGALPLDHTGGLPIPQLP